MEGLSVIADFQGKALDHEEVVLEYKEIRDAVLADVSGVSWPRKGKEEDDHMLIGSSEPSVIGHIERYGGGTRRG